MQLYVESCRALRNCRKWLKLVETCSVILFIYAKNVRFSYFCYWFSWFNNDAHLKNIIDVFGAWIRFRLIFSEDIDNLRGGKD